MILDRLGELAQILEARSYLDHRLEKRLIGHWRPNIVISLYRVEVEFLKPRALDVSARSGKKVETLPDAILDDVLAKLTAIFE